MYYEIPLYSTGGNFHVHTDRGSLGQGWAMDTDLIHVVALSMADGADWIVNIASITFFIGATTLAVAAAVSNWRRMSNIKKEFQDRLNRNTKTLDKK